MFLFSDFDKLLLFLPNRVISCYSHKCNAFIMIMISSRFACFCFLLVFVLFSFVLFFTVGDVLSKSVNI